MTYKRNPILQDKVKKKRLKKRPVLEQNGPPLRTSPSKADAHMPAPSVNKYTIAAEDSLQTAPSNNKIEHTRTQKLQNTVNNLKAPDKKGSGTSKIIYTWSEETKP